MPSTTGPAAGRAALRERQATRRAVLALPVLTVATLLPVGRVESGPVLCPVRRLTDIPCPGCGLTRSVTRTMHGQLRAATAVHPAGVPLTALLAAWALTGRAHADTALDPGGWTRTRHGRALLSVGCVVWLVWAGLRAF